MKGSRLEQDLGVIVFALMIIMFPIYLISIVICLFIPEGSTEV